MEGLDLYNEMYQHRHKYFGEGNRHTVQMARRLGAHIIEMIREDADDKKTYELNDETLTVNELLQYADDVLRKALEKCRDERYRRKITSAIDQLTTLREGSNRLENESDERPSKKQKSN